MDVALKLIFSQLLLYLSSKLLLFMSLRGSYTLNPISFLNKLSPKNDKFKSVRIPIVVSSFAPLLMISR